MTPHDTERASLNRRQILKGIGASVAIGAFGPSVGTVSGHVPDRLCEARKLDVVLVLDRSGSMGSDPDGDGNTKLDDMQAAATGFVDRLDSNDRVGLVTYNQNVTLDHQLTDNFSGVKSTINGLSAVGTTNIGGGLDTGHGELTSSRDRSDAANIMVLLSNGQPNTGPDPVTEANEAKSDGIRVMSIALGQGADDSLMKDIASDPDSENFFDAPTGADLSAVFQSISQELCPTAVEINIKPGSDPNAVNCGSEHVPVALLTTSDFDATTVDPSSLRFGTLDEVASDGGASLAHGDGHFEDAQPDSGDPDGDTDHVGHYPTEDTGFDGSQDTGYLVGETMSGEAIAGHDSVKLVGCSGKGGGQDGK